MSPLPLARACALAPALLCAHPAAAQMMQGMAMPQMSAPHGAVVPPATPQPHPNHVPAHNAPAMDDMDMSMDQPGIGNDRMSGALAPYPMTRDASGTAWQPDSEPHAGLHGQYGGWKTMLHGYATATYDDQGGPRGATESFVQSHVMAMAQHPVGEDRLTLHGAVSLDPFMGKGGYPLLLQTGETADGKTPLIHRQHPHNFFSELSVTYSHKLTAGAAAFFGRSRRRRTWRSTSAAWSVDTACRRR